MGASKTTPISKASSDREIGEFWDTHDLAEHDSIEVPVELDIQSSVTYFGLDKPAAEKLRSIAHESGESPERLLSRWIEEHSVSPK